MTDLHILGMAISGTTLARDMLLSVLRANSIDCLSMGEFFSLLRTYEYGDPLPVLLRDEHIPLQDQLIATAFGSDPRSWSHRMHDDGHVLKLWSKEDKLALVENHEEVRVILEESHDGLAIRG